MSSHSPLFAKRESFARLLLKGKWPIIFMSNPDCEFETVLLFSFFCSAYDRAAIKFRGVEADINFKIEDYEGDLKQVGGGDRDFIILSSIVPANLVSYCCVFYMLFFSLLCN